MSGPGDVNGDGRDDVLIGSTAADANRREDSGSAYVVFGRGPGVIDLASLRNRGFRIDGAVRFDYSASSVAGPGDLNGDGLADVVISAEQADYKGRESGSAYVVFGKRTTASSDLAKLGTGGLRLDGAAPEDLTSWSVSGLGDMNGDGQPDLLVGAQAASASGREHAGAAYVAFLPDITVPRLKASLRTPQPGLRRAASRHGILQRGVHAHRVRDGGRYRLASRVGAVAVSGSAHAEADSADGGTGAPDYSARHRQALVGDGHRARRRYRGERGRAAQRREGQSLAGPGLTGSRPLRPRW